MTATRICPTKAEHDALGNSVIYAPSNWHEAGKTYAGKQTVTINGNSDLQVSFDYSSAEFEGIPYLMPCVVSTSRIWIYPTVCISDATKDSCKVGIHNYDSASLTCIVELFAIY